MPSDSLPSARSARAVAVLVAVCCAVVAVTAVAGIAYRLGEQAAAAPPAAGETDASLAAAEAEAAGLATVEELFERLTTEAVDPPPAEELVTAAKEGMLEALDDPYAVLYDPEEFAGFSDMLEGTFTGIGVRLEDQPEGPTIVTVFDGSPAAEAGLEVGERITSVDGEPIGDEPLDAVVDKITGDEGTEVTIGLTGGSAGDREVTLERRSIELPNLTSRTLDSGAGYVGLLQFSQGVGEDVRAAVADLREQGVDGIVLDLRGNPGGLLNEAVDVASVFIEDGTVVTVRERGQEAETLEATGDAHEDLPLAVLVDQGSASASEIVAAAIQDHDRGTVVGETTFGKGTVQTIRSLTDGSGVKFTTAEYLTPSGASIEGSGVVPDREVAGRDAQLDVAVEVLTTELAGSGASAAR